MVKVHKCFSVELGENKPPRHKPKRPKNQPQYRGPICTCREEISPEEAARWVGEGLADWIGPNEICVVGRVNHTPRTPTIEKAHMERAYAFEGDDEERIRIEEYGLLTLMSRVQSGKTFHTLQIEPLEADWGRPILNPTFEGRTDIGDGKYVDSVKAQQYSGVVMRRESGRNQNRSAELVDIRR